MDQDDSGNADDGGEGEGPEHDAEKELLGVHVKSLVVGRMFDFVECRGTLEWRQRNFVVGWLGAVIWGYCRVGLFGASGKHPTLRLVEIVCAYIMFVR